VQVRIDRFRDFFEGFDMRFPGRGLSLDGSAELPADAAVDAESASATLKANGTLHVTIPKTSAGRDVAVSEEGDEPVDDHAVETTTADDHAADDTPADEHAADTPADGHVDDDTTADDHAADDTATDDDRPA
jgi:hypothetical protein